MSASAAPQPQPNPVTVTEWLGRTRELQRELAEGAARRSLLAGENAILVEMLRQSDEQIQQLRVELARLTQPSAKTASTD